MTDQLLSFPPDAVASLPKADLRDEATLALFGHDLRAALSDVVGGLRLIAPDGLDAPTRAQVERVQISAEVLTRLLDQGLSVMLGEAPERQPEHVALHQFLTDIDLRWSGRALETGIIFSVQRGQPLPGMLHVDRVALDRVVSNLLGNAFKYCERGRVVCDLSVRADGGLRITVRDDGPGYPAAVMDRPQPFQSRPQGTGETGSGLGLRIVANLTHLMGGELTICNLAPRGAQAQVDLPASVSGSAAPEPPEVAPFLHSKRVLIADDNPTSQTIAARMVVNLGAEVVVVADGVDAIARLERDSFDLLIADLEMPRISGLDVIRCVRRMPGPVRQIPIIAMTAHGLSADRKTILAAGANDLMVKPLLCPAAFANLLRGVMPPPIAPVSLSAAAHPGPAPMPATLVGGLDQDRLQRLLNMAGPETARELLDRLVSDLCTVQRGLQQTMPARTGVQPGVQPGAQPNWDAIRAHSHVLISLAGAVGALRLQAEAEALNQIGQRADRTALTGLLPNALIDLEEMIEVIGQVRAAFLVQFE